MKDAGVRVMCSNTFNLEHEKEFFYRYVSLSLYEWRNYNPPILPAYASEVPEGDQATACTQPSALSSR